eukprot:154979-Hanusia_phi.AAC.1
MDMMIAAAAAANGYGCGDGGGDDGGDDDDDDDNDLLLSDRHVGRSLHGSPGDGSHKVPRVILLDLMLTCEQGGSDNFSSSSRWTRETAGSK